jgi:hypothetical protein
MTQIKYLYINPTFIIWPIKTPPQASKRYVIRKGPFVKRRNNSCWYLAIT